jgi:DNA-directed RNA polymerase subunit RPC12/RpoP
MPKATGKMKECSTCGRRRRLENFSMGRGKPYDRQNECKDCNSKRYLKKKEGRPVRGYYRSSPLNKKRSDEPSPRELEYGGRIQELQWELKEAQRQIEVLSRNFNRALGHVVLLELLTEDERQRLAERASKHPNISDRVVAWLLDSEIE